MFVSVLATMNLSSEGPIVSRHSRPIEAPVPEEKRLGPPITAIVSRNRRYLRSKIWHSLGCIGR